VIGLAACGEPPVPPPFVAPHSSSIATSSDGATLFVVNPDSDSLSIVDLRARTLVAEVLLAGVRPTVDASGAFTPAVMPRALAVSPDDTTVFVTGERAGKLFGVDVATHEVRSVAVGSEPIGVTVSADGFFVFVACSQDAKVVVVAASTFTIVNTLDVPATPWTLGQTSNGSLLVGHLSGPGPSLIDPLTSVVTTLAIADIAPRGDARLAHGEARGMYDVAERPGTQELWVAHLLLGTDTAQPELDFETTVFPTLTVLRPDGFRATLSNDALDIPGTDGAFGDVVSGPHAIAFTADGELAFVVDTNSEDLLVVDANHGVELALVRPLPGHMPEGIALSPDEEFAYIDQRNTGDIAVVRIDRAPATGRIELFVDGPPIPRLDVDPMPATQRLGQHLFYSANSDESPITRNHWVACASCHVEGRSDAVVWKFEQGGTFEPTANAPQLDALADYVNHGIPLPIPPTTDPVLVAHGKAIFERADVGCATCHGGPRFTDSGAGNPTLDLAGTITLHDVGTCAMGAFPDVAHADVDGHPRAACLFDAPSLQGVASSPPYFHDGRAKTIIDALDQTRGKMGDITSLSPFDELALVEYVRSL